MDIALWLELLRQAEQSGASSAALFLTSSIRRTDSILRHHPALKIEKFESAKLIVVCSNGSCVLEFYSQNRMLPSRDVLMSQVQNACRAARLASVWGQKEDLLKLELKRFEMNAVSSVRDKDCVGTDQKTRCDSECFSLDCITEEMSFELLKKLDDRFVQSGAQSDYQVERVINAVVETLILGNDVTTQKRFDSVLKQSLVLKESELHLPNYRTIGQMTELPESVIDAGEIALRFEKFDGFKPFDVCEASGLCVSPWGMAVIGHEASHFCVDVSPGGRIVMNYSECLPVPACACMTAGIEISLERGLKNEVMWTRLPDNTLVVDAPTCWKRKNTFVLHVLFEGAWLLSNGKLSKRLKPVVLKIDLKKIWFYCRLAAKPYARISLKCRDGISDFQAPWGYFDLKPESGMI